MRFLLFLVIILIFLLSCSSVDSLKGLGLHSDFYYSFNAFKDYSFPNYESEQEKEKRSAMENYMRMLYGNRDEEKNHYLDDWTLRLYLKK